MAKVANPNRVYEDYDPPFDMVPEEGCDTILIYLPGYKKEQLRVQLTTSRVLKISGERQIGDNRWRRFHKEFQVPTNCDTKEITAKFEGGILYIRQPKIITPAGAPEQVADKGKAAIEAPMPSKPPHLPQPQPQPQPQRQSYDLPQPKPKLQARDQPRSLPQPQPQAPLPLPQSQQQAPLSEPQKGLYEKMEKKDNAEDAISKEERGKSPKKDEEVKDQCIYTPRPKQTVGRRGLFSELKKPENLKRLVVSVLLVLGIGFYTTYMFKSITRDDKEL
ncbi:pollen-specific leucine-rich repeat extensin-like protein 1 [Chenopodium quinoa]|uniref:pollen-specific leucine-rich repeat extensin-like protein 1 n=1 Tax=Chenopodium quinoa TaxID=63459 RepID=UPI000B77C788|nr:pollen-specific leucine-rich repeat extensin-like protein 1 [Chenopodium quinoa]